MILENPLTKWEKSFLTWNSLPVTCTEDIQATNIFKNSGEILVHMISARKGLGKERGRVMHFYADKGVLQKHTQWRLRCLCLADLIVEYVIFLGTRWSILMKNALCDIGTKTQEGLICCRSRWRQLSSGEEKQCFFLLRQAL